MKWKMLMKPVMKWKMYQSNRKIKKQEKTDRKRYKTYHKYVSFPKKDKTELPNIWTKLNRFEKEVWIRENMTIDIESQYMGGKQDGERI